MRSRSALRAFALIEATKGACAVLAGIVLLLLIHRGSTDFAGWLALHAHLDPDGPFPRRLLSLTRHLNDPRLLFAGAAISIYGLALFVEGYGLWYARRWAEWLAAVSGTVYVPIEVFELHERITALGVGALALNLVMVIYMLYCVGIPDNASDDERLGWPSTARTRSGQRTLGAR